MPSPAIKLRQRLVGVRRIIALDVRMDDPASGVTRPRKRVLVAELRSSCLVLPVAYFEEFLRDLMAYFVSRLCSGSRRVVWQSLPDELREAVLYGSGGALANIGRIVRRRPTEAEMLAIYGKLASPAADPRLYEIPHEVLCGFRANPGPGQVGKTLSQLGVRKVFERVAPILAAYTTSDPRYAQYAQPRAVATRLDDIVQARHHVAHGAGPGNKTRVEIEAQVDFVERLEAAIQTVAMDHLRSIR
jgi:hypothetical protein